MFTKGKQKATRIDTLIGQGTHIEGNINFDGGLRIDGSITGNINATGDGKSLLTVSEKGAIEGDVRVPNLLLNGQISGSVYISEHVELASKARIKGNIYYRLLEMAIGAEINGQMIHVKKEDEEILNVEHEVVEDTDAAQLEQKD